MLCDGISRLALSKTLVTLHFKKHVERKKKQKRKEGREEGREEERGRGREGNTPKY